MPSGDAHRSLARALDILELCSLNGSGYTLTQLSQHLGIAKGSVIRFYLTAKRRQHLSPAAHPAGPRLPDPGRPGSSLPHRPHGVPHWKHLSGRSQRPAGDLPPDARHRVGLPRDMPPRQPEKRGCLLPQKGGDPAAQPYRHGGGPQPAGLRHRRGQGSAG